MRCIAIAAVGLAVNLVAVVACCPCIGIAQSRAAHCCTCWATCSGSLAAIVAGGVIIATGWMPIDPILSWWSRC